MIDTTLKHRLDLDLLRALAVILVVLFHLDVVFPSGFVGVDVFFVLSGYLMAEACRPEVGVTDFYERRFRRILPAMLIILLMALILSPFMFLPFEVSSLADMVWGTLLLVPNVIFWRDNDYFSDLNFAPMLHYWSLGVELQYYIVLPFLLRLTNRNWRVITALTCLLFVLSLVLTDVSQKSAFYLLPTRMWEFLAGYLGWLLAAKSIIIPKPVRRLVVAAALLGIVFFSAVSISKENFPGYAAFVPVFLSFIVIVIGIENVDLSKFRLMKIISYVAKISFSIYLIHYPIIFFYKYQPFSSPSPLTSFDVVSILIGTVFLSGLSYKYLEAPFRNKYILSRKRFLNSMACLALVTAVVLLVFSFNKYFIDTYEKEDVGIFKAMEDRGAWRCSKIQKLKEPLEESCYLVKSDAATQRVYLVGDSHIDALKEVFSSLASANGAELRLNRTRCLLGYEQCSSQKIIDQVEKFHITDVVVHGYRYADFDYKDLGLLLEYGVTHRVRVHVIGPVPTYNISVPEGLYKEHHEGSSIIERISKADFRNNIPYAYTEFMERKWNKKYIRFYYPENYLCDEHCNFQVNSAVWYFDSHHLTMTGAIVLRPELSKIFSLEYAE